MVFSRFVAAIFLGATENAGRENDLPSIAEHENDGPSKSQGVKMQDIKMEDLKCLTRK